MFPKGHPSDPAGGPSDPPALGAPGLAFGAPGCASASASSAPFGATSFGISFAHFILRGELLSQTKKSGHLFRRYELSIEKFSQL